MELFQDKLIEREFVLYENHTLDTLKPVTDQEILNNIINPFTKKPYEGMLLMGPWAYMDLLNNNNRYYNEKNYLGFIEYLKKQIFMPRGVYGTLEHPKGFATHSKELSHKLVDIWYDPIKKIVYGILMVLNTPNGLIVQEVYKSGGQLGVSARAGGKEHKNADGTVTSEITLMITFDIVYHPGFTEALGNNILDSNKFINSGFQSLNENQNLMVGELFSYKRYKDNDSIVNLFEAEKIPSPKKPKLSKEDKQEQKQDGDILESGKPANKNTIENELGKAVDNDLKQSEEKKQKILDSMNQSTDIIKKKLGNAYYDDSSGFKTQGLNVPMNSNQISSN